MVTCPKCGAKNPDEARFCVSCGGSLNVMEGERKRGSTCFGQPERRVEKECFGLPHGGAIVGIIIGVLIIIFGLGSLFDWRINFGPLVMIVIGVLVVAGALYGYTRRR
jgi:uncharacterized membrane protein YvbJ